MTYKIIQPPFTLEFDEMSKKELTDYFQWFLGIMPDRINELSTAVRLTPGFEAWRPDKTPASLASGLADKTRDGRRLRELYDYWVNQIHSKA